MLIKVIDKENDTDFFITAKSVVIDVKHQSINIYDINDKHYCISCSQSECKSLSKWLWLIRSWSIHGEVVFFNV